VASPLEAGIRAVANQVVGHPLGFVNPLCYRLMNTPALHDEVAPPSPTAEVRTDFANLLNSSTGPDDLSSVSPL
jgi:hypothetical protein